MTVSTGATDDDENARLTDTPPPRTPIKRWSPLLDGELRERTREAVVAIAESLRAHPRRRRRRPVDAEAASLASGGAGIAIFFAYLAQSGLTSHAAETAERLLDAARAVLATADTTPSLYSGFTGIAWATEHLTGHTADADPVDDPNQDIDAALNAYLTHSPWTDDFDLVSGLVGIGVYALERLPRPGARAMLELVIDRLNDSAEGTAPGIMWHTSPELLPPWQRERFPKGNYNVGLAHGVPGVIALLGHACAAGVAEHTSRTMLSGAILWLLAQRMPTALNAMFPAWTAPGIESPPARSAWCYGDPGVAAALLAAARGTGEITWEHEAVALARHAADRPLDQTCVVDAGLCHGAAGLAHLFNRMYQTTGDARLADAARSWFERTLNMRRPGEGVGGFSAWHVDGEGPEGWVADPGLLTGAAGIGLALVAAITPIEPAWDRILLLSK